MKMKKLLTNRLIYLGLAALLEIMIYIALFRFVRDKAGWVEVILHRRSRDCHAHHPYQPASVF